ncbi:hypothetical protein SAICODRAFT_23340 [Saitoella complicata NRRL Y-17804]|uniref:non-specific serine/threonine protein kinase n=1 Tax=Saitoella complicata (strain BCRC 22490 / CBS 7301 / JCM 7358 / NBRC 10748 / NRRL Y-17804) TaxID=698492 RepID=A0A0E9NCG8_SAICN|nr:uncharacterized protein SAICODRAFT_23340 [Saitoella complicata NRRL Y-17804]ODQ55278.1 hypothetical protein SAICODRAFT_23340 [Saitoella complicata NRRL Y-17804]GAO47110.1 hypothetical protein G7K_1322-t1 [Saitoella complicata NRRL Y-17804]
MRRLKPCDAISLALIAWTVSVFAAAAAPPQPSRASDALAVISQSQNAVATTTPPSAFDVIASSAYTTLGASGVAIAPRSIDDWELDDIVLISTVEGGLYALDRQSGRTRWILEGAGAAVRSTDVGEIMAMPTGVNTNTSPDSGSGTYVDPADGTAYIVEPQRDGHLYIFTPNSGLQKLPLGIKQLVDASPFRVPGDDKVYVGRRETTLYSIDARTGVLLQAFGPQGSMDASAAKCKPRDLLDMDELDDEDEECEAYDLKTKDVLSVGRTDYSLTIHSGPRTVWNVTFSEWGPNTVDVDLGSQYEKTPDGKYISPMHDGRILAHDTNSNRASWFRMLDSPTIRIFDILRPALTDRPSQLVMVPQPIDPEFRTGTREGVQVTGATFVNTTESGGWYAMSEENYPLVGQAPRAKWYSFGHFGGVEWKDKIVGVHLLASSTHGSPLSIGQGAGNGGIKTIDGRKEGEKEIIYVERKGVLNWKVVWAAFGVMMLVLQRRRKIDVKALLAVRDMVRYRAQRHGMIEDKPAAVDTVPEMLKVNAAVEGTLALLETQEAEVGDAAPSPVVTPPAAEEGEAATPATPKPKRKRGQRGGKKKKQAGEDGATLETNGDKVDGAREAENGGAGVVLAEEIPLNGAVGSVDKVTIADSVFPLQINSLVITDKILGYGSHGTIVYAGTFENRDVAVKRMLLDFYDVASHEVSLLQESDDHPNVIRYFCKQQSERFLYIALELCPASLQDVIDRSPAFPELVSMMKPQQVLKQIAAGVQYLHSLKIVHRDLKPQNILVAPPRRSVRDNQMSSKSHFSVGQARVLISDFGLCKKLEGDQSSFRATTANAAGTSGWRAPELLVEDSDSNSIPAVSQYSQNSETVVMDTLSNRRVTRSIDIFSMGCVFYYVLSNGAHPFGDRYMREGNIIKGQYRLDHLDGMGEEGIEAKDLISRMISPDPRRRPDATNVLLHPYFWDAERRLAFLLEASDRFDIEQRDPPSELLVDLESEAPTIVGPDWHKRLDKNFIDNLGKYRKYDGAKIMDLLRALRNKKHHYQDLPANVQSALGEVPDGFLAYFTHRFSLLFLHVYYVIKACEEVRTEPVFRRYFEA